VPDFDGTFVADADLAGNKFYGNYGADPNTYCWHAAADTWRCVAGGADVVDITSTGIKVPDDIPLCLGDDDDFCIEHDTGGTPDGLRLTQKDCEGSPCDPLEFYKDAGANVIVLRASSVTNPDAKMTFGPPAASGFSVGANDVHITGVKMEVDAETRFDGRVVIEGHLWIKDNEEVYLGSGLDYIMEYEPAYTGLSIRTTTGEIWFMNDGDQDFFVGDRSQAIQLDGNTTDGELAIYDEEDGPANLLVSGNRFALGGDGGGFGCINQTISYADFVDGGGVVGTLVLNNGIPSGAVAQRAILHDLTGFAGGANSTATVQIGDGTDPDRYSTGTPDVYTTNAGGVDLGVPSGTAWHDAAKSVTVTITVDNDWSTISAGEATVVICYWSP
jgi:hypothetical protein